MANWIGVVASCIGVVVGVAGVLIALYERAQRVRVEKIVRGSLRRLAGEVRIVSKYANWTDIHLRAIGYEFTKDAPDLTGIRRRIVDGARDAASCVRQLGSTHSQIRGIQDALFNDSEETLPEIMADDVRSALAQGAAGQQTPVVKPISVVEKS